MWLAPAAVATRHRSPPAQLGEPYSKASLKRTSRSPLALPIAFTLPLPHWIELATERAGRSGECHTTRSWVRSGMAYSSRSSAHGVVAEAHLQRSIASMLSPPHFMICK